jgi:hypothetical protein
VNRVTSSDGTTIAFDRLGHGRPVIVVGGQLADALSNGQHRVLEGQEHVVPPEVLVPVLAEFLAG